MTGTYHRLVELLEHSGVRYRLIHHIPEGRTDVASLHRGHPLAQAAKSMVVRVAITKKQRRYVLAVVPGDRCVDLDAVRRLAGGVGAAFASRDVAERLAGSVSGSIMPISFHPELHVIVDRDLLEHDELFFNAARLDRSVALRTNDFLALAAPRIECISTHPTGDHRSRSTRPDHQLARSQ